MASADIYSQFLRPARSVADYTADLDNADMRRMQIANAGQTNALNAMTMQDRQRATAEAMADQNALQRVASAARTPEDLITGLRNSGRPALMKMADDREKGMLDRRKIEAEVGKIGAETAVTQGKTLDAKIDRFRAAVPYLESPQAIARWYQAQYQDPELGPVMQATHGPYEQVLQSMPKDPSQLQKWQQMTAMGMEKFLQEQRQRGDSVQRARNDLVGPDGKPNQAVIDAKKAVAAAGASKIELNTGQKGFDNELKLRQDFKGEPVYKAHQEMQGAYSQIKQALQQATPAGDLAGATKIMKLLDPGSVVRESELGMAMAATGLLDRAQNYAQNIISGNKLTPKQRVEFQALADALMGEAVTAYNAKRSEYEKLGSEYGLNAPRAIGPAAGGVKATPAAPAASGFKIIGVEKGK